MQAPIRQRLTRLVRRYLLATAVLLVQPAHGAIHFDWRDSFSDPERDKLEAWVEAVVAGVEALVGPFPFDLDIRIHRADAAKEPVPWANTRRGSTQGVNFHVQSSYPLEDFLRDWTAAHELSHLIIPYLGRESSWFAEGFASFMQYQVMMAMGVLNARQADDRYLSRLDRARSNYPYQHTPFPDSAADLRASGRYPTMYWGGAAYFLQVDQQLRTEENSSLVAVLERYLQCCRRDRKNLDTLVADLDSVSDSHIFSETLRAFRTTPGFPDYDMLE